MSDRRSTPRVTLHTMGEIHAEALTILDTRDEIQVETLVIPFILIDVSEGGLALMVMSDADHHPLGPVHVEFRLGGPESGWVGVDAVLVRQRRSITGIRSIWHLRVLSMEPGARVRVRDFVQNQLRAANDSQAQSGRQAC